ncbi:hypothetical protein [Clostridium estertheticum]|uniref:hypothetical protein n=1 Tax=Clostridium estertheticum TaxID=238834 RepID=UPI001C7D0664|nr:hypothetical protein [Clostridium estertheticum]MBX4266585.1 hypothetical protein [Clostridium estertheticum]WLC88077.1 hypothetical protein KTC95_18970 [Clostridium estertheticum]
MLGGHSREELEQQFDTLDKLLHKETYIQLQDKVLCQKVEIEELESTIETMKDNPINKHESDNGF